MVRRPREAAISVDEREFASAGRPQQRKLRELTTRLQADPFFGDRIQASRVPKEFRNLPNLFRLELPEGWRALYTVAGDFAVRVEIRIVWIGDHKRYDRLFGYS